MDDGTRAEERPDAVIGPTRGPAHRPEDLHRVVEQAINRADIDAFLDAHDDEATVVVPPDGRTVHGRAALRSAIAPLLELRPWMTTMVVKRLEAGGLALTHGRWRLTIIEDGCRTELSASARWSPDAKQTGRGGSSLTTPSRAREQEPGRRRQRNRRPPGAMTMDDISTFLAGWADAERACDAATTERLLTDDFVGIGPVGFQLPKPAWLQRQTSGDLHYDELGLDDVATRHYGDCAVTIARWNARGTAQGHPIPEATRITLVTVKQRGDWRLAGIHFSFIAGAPGAPGGPGPS